jgi:hypothetical protein
MALSWKRLPGKTEDTNFSKLLLFSKDRSITGIFGGNNPRFIGTHCISPVFVRKTETIAQLLTILCTGKYVLSRTKYVIITDMALEVLFDD